MNTSPADVERSPYSSNLPCSHLSPSCFTWHEMENSSLFAQTFEHTLRGTRWTRHEFSILSFLRSCPTYSAVPTSDLYCCVSSDDRHVTKPLPTVDPVANVCSSCFLPLKPSSSHCQCVFRIVRPGETFSVPSHLPVRNSTGHQGRCGRRFSPLACSTSVRVMWNADEIFSPVHTKSVAP